jgi:hypothetical protein
MSFALLMSELTDTSVSAVGNVGIVRIDGLENVGHGGARSDEPQRIRQHVEFALHIAMNVDTLNVVDVLDVGHDALRDEIGERRRCERFGAQRERENRGL